MFHYVQNFADSLLVFHLPVALRVYGKVKKLSLGTLESLELTVKPKAAFVAQCEPEIPRTP